MIETVHVLLVEDNQDFAATTAAILQERTEATFQVVVVHTLVDTLVFLKDESLDLPDVILLDVHLPNGTGLEVIRKVRAAADGRPVIVISGLGPEEISYDAIRAGADDFWRKASINWDHLCHKLIVHKIRADIAREKVKATAEGAAVDSQILKLRELDAALKELPGGTRPGEADVSPPCQDAAKDRQR